MRIIKFGRRVNSCQYDHRLDQDVWDKLQRTIETSTLWTSSASKSLKIYQLENLVYKQSYTPQSEGNCPDDDIICYTESITQLRHLVVSQNLGHLVTGGQPLGSMALIYQVDRTTLPQQPFLPINKYYNIKDVTRHIWSASDVNVNANLIFEYENETQIRQLYLEITDDEIDYLPYLQSLGLNSWQIEIH